MSTADLETWRRNIHQSDYTHLRTHPRLTNVDYLHLSDLYALLRRYAPQFAGDVFDFGCGGAPYEALFNGCKSYVRADIRAGPNVDKVLPENSNTNEPDNRYDLVVSTQVLEHVGDPARYLRECRRILRPGGHLLLTTHGMIEEHGCPWDYHRWTCLGLNQLVGQSGLVVAESGKLTAEFRASVQLANQLILHWRDEKNRWIHYALAVFRKGYLLVLMPVLHLVAGCFPEMAVVSARDPARLYTGIYVWAVKP